MRRALISEFIGTALLLATVVGSGIMAEDLSGGITGLALLANAVATGAMLFVLITVLGPVSGAHFNPVVTAAMVSAGRLPHASALPYIIAQITGALAGVWLAHLMFNATLLQFSDKIRWGGGQWISEAVATFGLVFTIFGCQKHNPEKTATAVGLYITAAYWFTASTSFANPVVTLARSLSDTFSGIALSCVLPFVVAQCLGTILAIFVLSWLLAEDA
jgi:glycerol uptake facilitator-like aquaporin